MHVHWEYELNARREALWNYLADTDWVNQHAGLPKIHDRFEAQPDGSNKHFAWFTIGPVKAEWEERPTLWHEPDFFEVERLYNSGPLKRFVSRTSLIDRGNGRTHVVVDTQLDPANRWLAPLMPIIAAQGKAGADRAFALAEKLAQDAATSTTPSVSGSEEALARFLSEASDHEFARIQPYVVADRYGVPRKAMLRSFLLATKAGRFNLQWDVICPSCRGTPNSYASLNELQAGGLHCPACNVDYGPTFDRSVEVTFNARPLGLGIDPPLYCIASPRRSAHVIAQTTVPARSEGSLTTKLKAGAYDMNAVGIGVTPFTTESNGFTGTAAAKVATDGVEFPHTVGTGELTITIQNELDRELVVRVEEGRWPDTIATAAHVTAMQDFRDLFSSEVLAPGIELGIQSLSILFTDLVGSTAMYSKAGDAPAFRLVTDHFGRMKALIDEHDGTIVKTIGDAIMAAFPDAEKCLRAALDLDASVGDLYHEGEPLRLRVGFRTGPCIAMRANDRLDYFGTTVNLAARLQSLAHGGEVTLSLFDADRLSWLIDRSGRHKEVSELEIKGFFAPVTVVRLGAA